MLIAHIKAELSTGEIMHTELWVLLKVKVIILLEEKQYASKYRQPSVTYIPQYDVFWLT